MISKKLIIDMALTIAIAFIVAVAASFLFNLIAHGNGNVDWDDAFELALVIGIVVPLARNGVGK